MGGFRLLFLKSFGHALPVTLVVALAVFCCVALTSGATAAPVTWRRVGTVTTLTNGQLCKTDGDDVICDTTTPTISSGLVGIGSTGPITSLDMSQEHDALALPVGTTGTRPTGGALTPGEIRYNQTSPATVEAYVNGAWISLVGGASGGGGTANYVARWTSSTVLGIGSLYDTGTLVSVGTTTTASTLGVYGGVSIGTTYVGTAAPTNGMIVQGNVGIGTTTPTSPFNLENTDTTFTTETKYLSFINGVVSPSSNQTTNFTTFREGSAAYLTVPASNTHNVDGLYGSDFQASNESTGITVESLNGLYGTATNDANATVNYMEGAQAYVAVNAGTVGNAYGGDFEVLTSGGTLDSEYDLYINSGGSGGSTINNRYGLYMDVPSNPATNDWGFYQVGTQQNYFGGKIGIGSATPITSLDLSQKTDALALPVGTTGNRPTGGNLTAGEIRYNQTSPATVEAYVNGAWISLVGSSSGGGGTANYVARWTSSTALGIGSLYDTGTLVSVGTTTTASTLGVYGGVSIGTSYVGTAAPTNGMIVQGNVGIGTTAPASPLSITSTLTGTASSQYSINNQANLAPSADQTQGTWTSSPINYGAKTTLAIPSANTHKLNKIMGGSSYAENNGTGDVRWFVGGELGAYNSSTAGNVSGDMRGGIIWAESDAGTVPSIRGVDAWTGVYGGTVTNQYGVFVESDIGGGTVTNRYGVYVNTPGSGTATNDYGFYEAGTQKNYFAGNVGIGTNAPSAKLDVGGGYIRALDDGSNNPPTTGKGIEMTGNGDIGSVLAYNRGADTYEQLQLNDTMYIDGDGIDGVGNVGIGTTTPVDAALVISADTTNVVDSLELNNTATGGGSWILGDDAGSAGTGSFGITNNSAYNSPRLVISPSGNIGIGTITPGNTLTVNGTVGYMLGTNYSTIGTQQDVNLGTTSAVRYTGASVATFQGIVAGTNGQILYIHNASSSTLTLSNQNSSETTAANRIITGTGTDLPIPTQTSVAMQYDATSARWRVTGSSNSANTLAAGSTGQVQFNGGSNLAANANFFWDDTNKSLNIGTSTNSNASFQSIFAAKPSYTEIAVSGDGGAHYMGMSADSGSAYLYNTVGNLRMQPFGSFTVEQSNIPQFIVTQAGNVGIGTTSPNGALQIGSSITGTMYNTSEIVDTFKTQTGVAASYYSSANFNTQLNLASDQSQSGGPGGRGSETYATNSYILIPSPNTHKTGGTFAINAEADNGGTGNIDVISGGNIGAYNYGASTASEMQGVLPWAESDIGTVTDLIGVAEWSGVYGGTVTDEIGLDITSDIGGGTVTNRYGIYLEVPTGAATNEYGIYQAGTQNNYFAGNVGIGTATPNLPLTVDVGNNDAIHTNASCTACSMLVSTINSGSEIDLNNINGRLGIFTFNSGVPGERISVTPTGNVGIGTTSPARPLHVVISDSATSTTSYPLRVTHKTSGTAADNLGTGIEFAVQNPAGTMDTIGTYEGDRWADTSGTSTWWEETMLTGGVSTTPFDWGTWQGGLGAAGSYDSEFDITSVASGANGSSFIELQRARGTESAKTAVQNGDIIGQYQWGAYDGANWVYPAEMNGVVDDAVTAGSVPMGITFNTGATGSDTERMRITSAGNVGIGTTNPATLLHVNGVETVGLNGGTGGQITFNGATSGSVALSVQAAAGSGTVFQLPATNGSSGYVLQTNGSGVTSWVAAPAPSFSGLTDTYFCTASGTTAVVCSTGYTGTGSVVLSASPTLTGTITAAAANFSGNVGIGTTTPGRQLQVMVSDAATTNANAYPLRLSHKTSGTAGNNLGTGIEFQVQNPSGTMDTVGTYVASTWADTSGTSSWWTMNMMTGGVMDAGNAGSGDDPLDWGTWQGGSAGSYISEIDLTSVGNEQPYMDLYRANGVTGAKTTVANADVLGAYEWNGYDGTAMHTPARIMGVVNGTVATNSIPTDITFETGVTAGGTEKMRITSGGNVGIGTATPSSLLETYDSAAKTTSYVSVLHDAFDTSSTASINKVGMDIESTGTWNGASAVNVGLLVNVSGGTANYAAIFGGAVGIGTTAPSTALQVVGIVTATTFSGSGASLTAIPESALTALSANQVLGSLTAVAPSGLTMPSCSTSSSALLWTSGTGFSCNASINAATLGGATFAAPGAIGGTTPGSGAFTTLSASGAITDSQSFAAATSVDGLILTNSKPAKVNAQEYSPRVHFTGRGWETNTAASELVDMIEELQPVQGAADPSGNLVWSDSINGGAYGALMTLTTDGNVGIGTTSPGGVLDVVSSYSLQTSCSPESAACPAPPGTGYGLVLDSDYTTGQFRYRMQPIDRGGNISLYVQEAASTANSFSNLARFGTNQYDTNTFAVFGNEYVSGNVGIGTTAPNNLLTVNGGSHPVTDANAGAAAVRIGGSGGASTDSGILMGYDTTANLGWIQAVKPGTANYPLILQPNGSNVGIGTAAPAQPLTISGYAAGGTGTTAQIIGTAASGTSQNELNITSGANAWGLILGDNNSGVATSSYHCASCAHIINVNNAALNLGANNAVVMTILGSGVGIGTTSPQQALHVVGSIRKDFTANNSSGGTSYWLMNANDGVGNWNEYLNSIGGATPTAVAEGAAFRRLFTPGLVAGTNILYMQYAQPVTLGSAQTWKDFIIVDAKSNYLNLMDGGGNVGIGTTSPSTTLQVNGTVTATGFSGPMTSGLDFPLSTWMYASGAGVRNWYIGPTDMYWEVGSTTGDFHFRNSSDADLSVIAGAANRNTYFDAGNVGIGTTGPAALLDVEGSSANTSTQYINGLFGGVQSTANTSTFYGLKTAPTYTAASGNTLFGLVGITNAPANTSTGTVTSLYGDYTAPLNNSSGTVGSMYGVLSIPTKASTGVVTTMYGLYSRCDNKNATGAVTTCYELYLDTPTLTGAITNNYGVYQTYASATNYFAGNVGIGTTTPNANLDINGISTGTNHASALGVKGAVLGGTAGNYSYPSEVQNVSGNGLRLQTAAYRRKTAADWDGGAYRIQYAVDNSFTDGSKAYIELGSDDPNAAYGGFISFGTAGSDRLSITSGGNVGIGTTSPGALLNVLGNSTNTASNYIVSRVDGAQSTANTSTYYGLDVDPTYSAASGNTLAGFTSIQSLPNNTSSGTVTTMYGMYNSPLNTSSGTVTTMYGDYINPQNTSSGTVGNMFGVSSIVQKNSTGVVTTMYGLYSRCDNGNATGAVTNCYELYLATPTTTGAITNKYGVYQTDSGSINYFAGNVGIETTSPTEALQVSGNINTALGGNVTGAGGYVSFSAGTNQTFSPMALIKGALYNMAGTEQQGDLTFQTRPYGVSGQTMTERMRITNAGLVGIGTTTPGTGITLDVNGIIRANAGLYAQGATPDIFLTNTSAGVDSKNWYLATTSGTQLISYITNDLNTVGIDYEIVTRSGDSISSIAFPNGSVGIGTTGPGYSLDIENPTAGYALNIGNVTVGSWTGLNINNDGVQTDMQSIQSSGLGEMGTESNNGLIIRTNGTERIRILAGGNVGIGTTVPNTTLDVTGSPATFTTGTADQFQLTRITTGGVSWGQVAAFQLGTYNASGACCGPQSRLDINLKAAANSTYSGDTNVMTLLSSGKVGIGTTGPGYSLDIENPTAGYALNIGNVTVGSWTGLNINNDGVQTDMQSIQSSGLGEMGTESNNGLIIRTNGTERIRILAGGNVGIGSTGPSAKLDISGVTDTTAYVSERLNGGTSGYGDFIQFTDAATYNYAFGTTTNGDFTWMSGRFPGTAGTERMRLTQGGNVGIGTAAPAYPLEAYSSAGTSIEGYNTSTGDGVYGFSASGYGVLGTTTAGGSVYCGGSFVSGSYNACIGRADGYAIVGTGVGWFTSTLYDSDAAVHSSSDRRLKTDIAPVDGGTALETIGKLNPVLFRWRHPSLHDNHADSSGFIAQEMQQIFPHAVTELPCTGADCELVGGGKELTIGLGLEYQAYIVKALQQLKSMSDTDHGDIAKLKAFFDGDHEEIARLKADNDNLHAAYNREAAQIKALTQGKNGICTMQESKVVPILVEGMKKQEAQIENDKKEIADLATQLAILQHQVSELVSAHAH